MNSRRFIFLLDFSIFAPYFHVERCALYYFPTMPSVSSQASALERLELLEPMEQLEQFFVLALRVMAFPNRRRVLYTRQRDLSPSSPGFEQVRSPSHKATAECRGR